MRIPPAVGGRQADLREELRHLRLHVLADGGEAEDADGLGDDPPDAPPRVEARVGVLKHICSRRPPVLRVRLVDYPPALSRFPIM